MQFCGRAQRASSSVGVARPRQKVLELHNEREKRSFREKVIYDIYVWHDTWHDIYMDLPVELGWDSILGLAEEVSEQLRRRLMPSLRQSLPPEGMIKLIFTYYIYFPRPVHTAQCTPCKASVLLSFLITLWEWTFDLCVSEWRPTPTFWLVAAFSWQALCNYSSF